VTSYAIQPDIRHQVRHLDAMFPAFREERYILYMYQTTS
jgi:hypothetical protein